MKIAGADTTALDRNDILGFPLLSHLMGGFPHHNNVTCIVCACIMHAHFLVNNEHYCFATGKKNKLNDDDDDLK